VMFEVRERVYLMSAGVLAKIELQVYMCVCVCVCVCVSVFVCECVYCMCLCVSDTRLQPVPWSHG